MQKLLSSMLFISLLAIPFHSHAQNKAIQPGEYISEGGWGNLTVTRNKQGGLSFEISSMGANGHTCNLSGDIRNGRAVLEGSEESKPCIVTFKPSGNGLNVTDNDGACSYFCGVRAGFTNLYIKPQPACKPAAIQKTRDEFKKLYDRKAYSQARAKLEPVLKNCSELIHWTDMGWIQNDLAITLYKLGDYAGCRNTLRTLKEDAGKTDDELREQYPPADADIAIPIAKATRTNLRLCTSGKKKL